MYSSLFCISLFLISLCGVEGGNQEFFSSRQSVKRELNIRSSRYSDWNKSLNQYSVSAVSLSEMCSFDIKSALLFPYCASLILAPMDVPLLIICLEMICSFCASRYLHNLIILAAKSIDLSIKILSFICITNIILA